MFVLRLARLGFAELAEELEVFLAFIASLENGKILQCLNKPSKNRVKSV